MTNETKGMFDDIDDLTVTADDIDNAMNIDVDEATVNITKGLDAGVKAGIKQGAQEGIKPIAKQMAEKIVADMANGGNGGGNGGNAMNNSPLDRIMSDMQKSTQLDMMQTIIDNMKAKKEEAAMKKQQAAQQPMGPMGQQQQPPSSSTPVEQLVGIMKVLEAAGYDPKNVFENINPSSLVGLINPTYAPFFQPKAQVQQPVQGPVMQPAPDNSMFAVMVNYMSQQQQQQQQQMLAQQQQQQAMFQQMIANQQRPPPDTNKEDKTLQILIAMMQENQKNQEKVFNMQMQMANQQQNLMLAKFEPILKNAAQPPATLSDHLGDFKQNIDVFKQMGLFGEQNHAPQNQADLEVRKMAFDLEQRKLDMESVERLKNRELEMKNQERQSNTEMLNTVVNVVKNLGIADMMKRPPPGYYNQQQQPPQNEPAQPTMNQASTGNMTTTGVPPISEKIKNSINAMLMNQENTYNEPQATDNAQAEQ